MVLKILPFQALCSKSSHFKHGAHEPPISSLVLKILPFQAWCSRSSHFKAWCSRSSHFKHGTQDPPISSMVLKILPFQAWCPRTSHFKHGAHEPPISSMVFKILPFQTWRSPFHIFLFWQISNHFKHGQQNIFYTTSSPPYLRYIQSYLQHHITPSVPSIAHIVQCIFSPTWNQMVSLHAEHIPD